MVDSNKVMIIQSRDEFCCQFVTAIRALRYLMVYMGIWPGRNYEKLYSLFWYFHSACLLFLICGFICGLSKIGNDMNQVISNLSATIGMLNVIAKWLTFSRNKVLVRKLMHSMNRDCINLANKTLIHGSVPDSEKIMTKHYRALNIYIYTIIIALILANGNFVVDYVATEIHHGNHTDLDNILPLSGSWYPVDRDQVHIIQFLAVVQVCSLITGCIANTVVDGLFLIAVLHTTGQLEILGNFIERMKYDSSDTECVKRNVTEMAKRHQLLISVTVDIQECYGMITFQHVSTAVLSICFSEYAFLMELQRSEEGQRSALKYGINSLAGLANVFIYCFVGNCLTSQGLAIGMNIYNSEWYNAASSTKLSLSIMMTYAWKPILLSATRIFPLTLQSFTVVVKSVASYLSALRALNMSYV